MNIWSGHFIEFKKAKKKSKGKGFLSKKWRNSQFLSFQDCLLKEKNNKRLPSRLTHRYKNFNKILEKKFKHKKNISILDFGGGFGLGFFSLDKKLKKKINYFIVENKNITSTFKPIFKKINYFSFINAKIHYDIINCCSVIQYIENWKEIVKKLSNTKTEYLYFSDMFIGDIKTFVTLQKYFNSTIPHWFINFKEFNNELIKNKYKLIQKKKNDNKKIKFHNCFANE